MPIDKELDALLGLALNWEGATAPTREELAGSRVQLEPLDAARHGAPLYRAGHGEASPAHLWTFLPYGPFESQDTYTEWLREQAESADPLFYAVVPSESAALGEAQGVVSFLRVTPEHGSVEIGHVWFGPGLSRTRAATEAVYLLLRHAFDLGFRRVEWKCHHRNAASHRAALRFGFHFEGVFRAHMVVKGRNRDTDWFSMLDSEWPARRAAFEAWLDDANFDENGQQKRALESFAPN